MMAEGSHQRNISVSKMPQRQISLQTRKAADSGFSQNFRTYKFAFKLLVVLREETWLPSQKTA